MKLDGLTVLDLSLFLPGPAATQLMADHGARVIKVENPRAPEPTRSADAFPWQQGGETVMFRNTQRGKESIAVEYCGRVRTRADARGWSWSLCLLSVEPA